MAAAEDVLRTDTELLLRSLPSYDLIPCEKRVMDHVPVNPNAPYGERRVRDCGTKPTYLLKPRNPRSVKAADDRVCYCRAHALDGSEWWQPVVNGGHDA